MHIVTFTTKTAAIVIIIVQLRGNKSIVNFISKRHYDKLSYYYTRYPCDLFHVPFAEDYILSFSHNQP